MNPLGDENGALAIFGVCTLVVLGMAIALRARRHPIALTALLGMIGGVSIYGLVAALSLLSGGARRYHLATWLILVGAGGIPAGLIGLVEGLIASTLVRLFEGGPARGDP